jgi:hypothetical protein
MRIGRTGKLLAILSVVALAVSVVGVTPSGATPAGMSAKHAGAVRATSDEVSARKRGHVRHYRSGNRAALQTFGAIAGTIGGIIAADQARRAYRHYYNPYYSYGYSPYGYQPYGYYGGYSYY